MAGRSVALRGAHLLALAWEVLVRPTHPTKSLAGVVVAALAPLAEALVDLPLRRAVASAVGRVLAAAGLGVHPSQAEVGEAPLPGEQEERPEGHHQTQMMSLVVQGAALQVGRCSLLPTPVVVAGGQRDPANPTVVAHVEGRPSTVEAGHPCPPSQEDHPSLIWVSIR